MLLSSPKAWGSVVLHTEEDEFWAEVRHDADRPRIEHPLSITCRLDESPGDFTLTDWPPPVAVKDWLSILDGLKAAGILRLNFEGFESLPKSDVLDLVRAAWDREFGVVVSARDCTPDLDRCLGFPRGVMLQVHLNPARALLLERSRGFSLARRFDILRQCIAAGLRVKVLSTYDPASPLALAEIAAEMAQANVYDWVIFPQIRNGREDRLPQAVLDEMLWIGENIPRFEVREGRPERETALRIYPNGEVLAEEALGSQAVQRGTLDELVAGKLLSGAFLDRHAELWVSGVRESHQEVLHDPAQDLEAVFDAFLSYHRKDHQFAAFLHHELERLGVKTWLDDLDIEAGKRWQEEIEKALQKAWTLIVCIGPSGLGTYQEFELQMALSLVIKGEMRVIPVILPDGDEASIPLSLSQFQYVDFRRPETKPLQRLVKAFLRDADPLSQPVEVGRVRR